ncbi:MAG: S-layer homology domain-containing protein [Candidatus Margulisbacteria bacterium]|nr:S-layer homology domain-containing protein [Candidatus Margulisiibacteriota bacterium]
MASDIADPMRIGVGARSMGMGKAYVGLAQDGDAIFLNPAGIAQNPSLKLTSMYSKLLNEVDYTVVGGVIPNTDYSAFGLGYVGHRTGDIPLRSAAGTSEGTASWGENVLVASYAAYINKMFPALGDHDILVGGNFKYYSAGASGSLNTSDSGMAVDLALLTPITSFANLGINAQNVLAGTMSQSGDTIPYCYKIGTKIAVIGKEDEALIVHKNRQLNLLLDADVERTGTTLHVGGELWPTRNLALRLGLDGSDVTAGAGIRFYGVEFDYAYHPYSGIAENTSHYFSLAYVGESSPRVLTVKLDSPADKSVVYNDFVSLAGKVEVAGGEEGDDTPITLKVNDISVPVNKDRTFAVDIPIEKYGKSLLSIKAESGLASDSQEIRLVRLNSFADVPEGYWAKQPIENTSTVGLINGYPDGTFRPGNELTRAELATLMIRAMGGEPKGQAQASFKDVPKNFWAARYIEEAKRLGLIKGYKTKKGYVFRPNNKVKMGETVAILARFDKLPVASYASTSLYSDVPAKHWSAKYVEAAKNAGMLTFITGAQLGVNKPVSRAEAVKMLSSTSVAGNMINDLYAWEKGFKREMYYRPKIKAGIEATTATLIR